MKITIDRSKPFDIASFTTSKLWSIVEQDEKSIALTEINIPDIALQSTLKEGENLIDAEENLRRLKNAGDIRFDANVLKTLWENQNLIPLEWRDKTNNFVVFIFFDGTIFESPEGERCSLCLFWSNNMWNCKALELKYKRSPSFLSAVLIN
jgi:hypothetical protein